MTGRGPRLEDRGVSNLTSRREPPMSDETISPLRRRMIEDLTVRGIGAKTRHD